MPVVFSYACKADTERARKLVDSEWSPMLQANVAFGREVDLLNVDGGM